MTFGIITTEAVDNTVEHYVGEDAVLWDWLQGSNLKLAAGGNLYRLQAPVGYVFYHDNLVPVEDYAGYDGGRDSVFVSLGFGKEAKALMLLLSLRFVSPEVFTELGIAKERIIEVETYKHAQ